MRLYAFLLFAVAALHARAATIPASITEKKLIEVIPEELDKSPENISSEQELIDQTNTIKDVENKLRVKLEDIPVKVIVEDAQPALKTDDGKDESQDINRPRPDLRNPGPPQRQEHETQNPEYYATEQQTIFKFKQSLKDTQNILQKEFQGISEGIQNMLRNKVQIPEVQQSIRSLRESFTAQINKLNGTIQNYLQADSSSITQPAVEQIKASFHQIEEGLNTLRHDFNREVENLADGVEVVASLKADNEKPVESNPSSASTVAPTNPSPPPASSNPLQFISDRIQNMVYMFGNMTQNLGWNNILNPASSTTAVPEGTQSDTQVPAAAQPGGHFNITQIFPSQAAPFQQTWNTIQNLFQGFPNFLNLPMLGAQTPQGTQSAKPSASTQPAPAAEPTSVPQPSKPTETSTKPEAQASPAQPVAATQAAAVTPFAPIRQILQNNPISKGIADAVQRLQNLNNPDKPREVEKLEESNTEEEKKQDEDKSVGESKKKGHYYGTGGANTGE